MTLYCPSTEWEQARMGPCLTTIRIQLERVSVGTEPDSDLNLKICSISQSKMMRTRWCATVPMNEAS